jgi:hypothetical protein
MAMRAVGPRVTGVLLVISAVLVNAAFIGLGSAFNYPQVLQEPGGQVLATFAERASMAAGLFTLLALGAALLAPIAAGTARFAGPSRWSTAAAATGVAAALVQVVGLARWPLLVPSLATTATDPAASVADRAGAVEQFGLLNTVLGQIVGEAAGYLLTAAWTVLVLAAMSRRYLLPQAFTIAGLVSAPMILAGLLVPLDVPGADSVNFAGYVLWSVWTIAFGLLLLTDRFRTRPVTGSGMATSDPTPRPLAV